MGFKFYLYLELCKLKTWNVVVKVHQGVLARRFPVHSSPLLLCWKKMHCVWGSKPDFPPQFQNHRWYRSSYTAANSVRCFLWTRALSAPSTHWYLRELLYKSSCQSVGASGIWANQCLYIVRGTQGPKQQQLTPTPDTTHPPAGSECWWSLGSWSHSSPEFDLAIAAGIFS